MNRRLHTIAALSLGLAATSCTHRSGPPVRIRAGEPRDVGSLDTKEHPLVIEFREGDTIPFDVAVEGDVVASPPGASIPLLVKRPFFLRIRGDEIKVSLDGSFEDATTTPGALSFGLGVTREGTRAKLVLRTPGH
ncbi:MAG: hypothetical protein JST00_07520 [Deltaproteobacteria bacterium]|nr:hypothetical protein [Deltaproteobacteria bacterium]